MDFNGAGTWTLCEVDQKCLESSEMRCWRRIEGIIWTESVKWRIIA